MTDRLYDIAVIGGGINGAGIARDAAGRGANVLLLEARDLASGTSSASTKLIHGGLRYLEHREFGLVREALAERERLWAIAPHLIHPLRFVLPHVPGSRPRWLLRLGLFLYDHIGGRKRLPPTQAVRLSTHPAGAPLQEKYSDAFIYSDCWVDDARLVVLNARDAADRGAEVKTNCMVHRLYREDSHWRLETASGTFLARAVVNAAGPWVLDVQKRAGKPVPWELRLVRGSHILLPKLFDHDFAYFFQLADSRVIFAIPFDRNFTLVGTTDDDHHGPLEHVGASTEEIAYLCNAVSGFFRKPVSTADVVWSFAGVRPLVDDHRGRPEAVTRGYRLELSAKDEGAPLLTVLGGKITTYRHLAERALHLLRDRIRLPVDYDWSSNAPLPGGAFAIDGLADLAGRAGADFPFLTREWIERLVRAYGTEVFGIFQGATCLADCGRHFGHGLTERELRHLAEREWARTAEDVLWRRTKLGLHFSAQEQIALAQWLAEEAGEASDR